MPSGCETIHLRLFSSDNILVLIELQLMGRILSEEYDRSGCFSLEFDLGGESVEYNRLQNEHDSISHFVIGIRFFASCPTRRLCGLWSNGSKSSFAQRLHS
jgi:hypothetical protein